MGYLACAAAGCLWGTGFYFGKIALAEMSVGHMVLYRFLFASLGLAFVLRRPHFSLAQWRLLLIASFLGVPVQFLLQFWGLKLTTVSHAALMVGTLPVILAVGATVFTHERLDGWGWLALAGSTTGVSMIVLQPHHAAASSAGGSPSVTGDLLVVLSMVLSLGWILINKHMVRDHPPMVVTACGLMSGAVMLAVWVLARDGMPPVHTVSVRAWVALAASGLLCTASSTLLWNWGMHHVPASRAGVFLNLEPALGSILGVRLMGDHLGPLAWVGGALILAAAMTLTTRRAQPELIVE
jgi:drug/metabolite transporter (DMT)-like permease